MAWEAYIDSNRKLSIRKAAKHCRVKWETLRDRIKARKIYKDAAEAQQCLTLVEARIIERHIMQLEVWGWPPMVTQVQKMARELLIAKRDLEDIGINWI
jgi:hypothetical protein